MIYLFTGDDADNRVRAYEKFIASIAPSTEKFFINKNDIGTFPLESFYSGAGLFFSKSVVVFRDVLSTETMRSIILPKLELMQESPNLFVFLEGKLLAPAMNAFKKVEADIKVFELPKQKKEKFDNFLLANAFSKKDKLHLWIYFRQAMDKGVGMEELVGVLFWKIKDMILRKNFGLFSKDELNSAAMRLAYILPEARKDGRDAETSLEKFLLEAF